MIILCGQARSGTSMMMRMLQMGGIDIEFDTERDNPEILKKFRNIYGMFETNNKEPKKSFKCCNVDIAKKYSTAKIIFIERDINEVILSWKEIAKKELHNSIIEQIKSRREEWHKFLVTRPHLFLKYDEVHKDPLETAQKIADFIKEPFDVINASKAVDKNLYIERSK